MKRKSLWLVVVLLTFSSSPADANNVYDCGAAHSSEVEPLRKAIHAVQNVSDEGNPLPASNEQAILNRISWSLVNLYTVERKNTDKNAVNVLCARTHLIDKILLDSKGEYGTTVLAEAVKTRDPERLNLVLEVIQDFGGSVDATSLVALGTSDIDTTQIPAWRNYPGAPAQATPSEVARSAQPDGAKPVPDPANLIGCTLLEAGSSSDPRLPTKAACEEYEHPDEPKPGFSLPTWFQPGFSASNALSPVTPDSLDATQVGIPTYISTLLTTAQGVQLNNKDTNGVQSVQIQGEVRLNAITAPFRYAGIGNGSDRIFLYTEGDLNSKSGKSPLVQPDWWSGGIGFNQIARFTPSFDDDTAPSAWASTTLRLGKLENRVPANNLWYTVYSFSETGFLPVAFISNLNQYTTGSYPMYVSLTGGAQHQDQNGGVNLGKVPGRYEFGTFAVYAYPCQLIEFCARFMSKNPTAFTIKLSKEVVNEGGGQLKTAALSYNLNKNVSFTLTRLVGIQDALGTFGAPQPKTAITQVGLQIK